MNPRDIAGDAKKKKKKKRSEQRTIRVIFIFALISYLHICLDIYQNCSKWFLPHNVYTHISCVGLCVHGIVQRNWACLTWKSALEIKSLLLLHYDPCWETRVDLPSGFALVSSVEEVLPELGMRGNSSTRLYSDSGSLKSVGLLGNGRISDSFWKEKINKCLLYSPH